MIRRMKYIGREEAESFVEKFPPHSCLIWDSSNGESLLFESDNDKILKINRKGELDYEKIIEFVIINNSKKNSNTTFYCEDYTLSIFFDDMLCLLPGRLHMAGDEGRKDQEVFDKLKECYAEYVLGGVL